MTNPFSALLSVICFVLGLLYFWPLCALAIALAVFTLHGTFALAFGILFDILYGAPPSYAHVLPFPLTFLSILLIVLRLSLSGFFRPQYNGDFL